MNHKLTFITLLLVVGIALSGCVSVAPGAAPLARTISVTGTAELTLTPDIAYISIGVHTEGSDAAEAVTSNNSKAQKITEAIQALGIDPKDILTTNFSVYPSQQYDPNGQITGTLFMVDNTVYITLRDINKMGEILGGAVAAGANNISNIQFDVADKTAALAEGRKAAIANARSQAEEIAQAAGVSIGNVQTISFYNNYPTPVARDVKAAPAGYGGGSVPVSAGQMTISVEVNIVYELK